MYLFIHVLEYILSDIHDIVFKTLNNMEIIINIFLTFQSLMQAIISVLKVQLNL
jgi:hypothetical protein